MTTNIFISNLNLLLINGVTLYLLKYKENINRNTRRSSIYGLFTVGCDVLKVSCSPLQQQINVNTPPGWFHYSWQRTPIYILHSVTPCNNGKHAVWYSHS